MVYDTKVPLPAASLRRLYGSYDDYVKQFEAAKATSIRQGYLLAEDAEKVQPVAKADDF